MITRKVKTDSGRKGSHLRLLIAGILVAFLSSLLLFGAAACSLTEESPEMNGGNPETNGGNTEINWRNPETNGGNPEPTQGPHIQFEQELIDLGTASPGDKLHAEFHFRNAGNETLEIGKITTEVATEGC